MPEPEWQEIKQPLEGLRPVQVSTHRISSQSPFNLPTALRAAVSPSGKTTKIEFRYIEDEAVKLKSLNRDVTVWVGRTSKRIRGIQVRRQSKSQSGSQNLDTAIDQLINTLSPNESQAESNYQIVRKVAHDTLADIEA